jgi:hypothetical protein
MLSAPASRPAMTQAALTPRVGVVDGQPGQRLVQVGFVG